MVVHGGEEEAPSETAAAPPCRRDSVHPREVAIPVQVDAAAAAGSAPTGVSIPAAVQPAEAGVPALADEVRNYLDEELRRHLASMGEDELVPPLRAALLAMHALTSEALRRGQAGLLVVRERRKAREGRSFRKSKKGKGEGKKEGDPPE